MLHYTVAFLFRIRGRGRDCACKNIQRCEKLHCDSVLLGKGKEIKIRKNK
jgi:hypothetical protein